MSDAAATFCRPQGPSKKHSYSEAYEYAKGHGFFYYLGGILTVVAVILILAAYYLECAPGYVEVYTVSNLLPAFWCSQCPAGTGTGGRKNQKNCAPSCDAWQDSLGRTCTAYDEDAVDLCGLAATSYRDLNGVSANEACYACMKETDNVGCTAAGLPVQTLLKGEDGVAAASLVLSAGSETLYISDIAQHRIMAMRVAHHSVSLLCGAGGLGFVDGPAASAKFNTPRGMTIDEGSGILYVADEMNHAIRAVALATGLVSTLAGSGNEG